MAVQVSSVFKALLRGILFLALFFGVYYFFFLRPDTLLPQRLAAAQTDLTELRADMLDNRLALTGLARLRPSGTFAIEQEDLLTRLAQTNQKGATRLDGMDTPSTLARVRGGSALVFYNDHLLPAHADLLEKISALYRDQKELIARLEKTDRILLKAVVYKPEVDFGEKTVSEEDRVRLLGLVEEALVELEAFDIELNDLPEQADRKAVDSALASSKKSLEILLAQLRIGRRDIDNAQADVLKKLSSLKSAAWEAERSVLLHPDTVDLLTRETNLMLEYDFWLQNIERHQQELYKASEK